ncbi:MAG: 50S ribosomal protein L24 [Gammaproteobacteria bacterium]|nr:50S ribosomal protein L24 [Gammaproteobacteria bacterium]
MKRRIRVDDQVIVIAGRDKGRMGYVVRFVGSDRVVVSNVNVVKRHVRATQEGEQSGILEQEAPLHISNVAIYNPNTQKRDKIKFVEEEGERVRTYKSTNEKVA